MTADQTRDNESGEGFTEPSEDVKRRNRITGFIIAAVIFGMIATAMLVRVYGS